MTEATDSLIPDLDESKTLYPGVSDRVKAVIADSVVLIAFMFLISQLFAQFETVPEEARIFGFIFVFVLYEPLFISVFGATIGHRIMKLHVKRLDKQTKKVLFPIALIRYFLKFTLGWISLLTVGRNAKNQAIHDMAAHSVVLYHEEETQ